MARKSGAHGDAKGRVDGADDVAVAERALEFSPTARYYAPFAEAVDETAPADGKAASARKSATQDGAGTGGGAGAKASRKARAKGRATAATKTVARIVKGDAAPAPRPAPSSKDARFPSRPRERLTLGARALANRLAPQVSLVHTVRGFPHVLNRLALVWEEPRRFYRFMDELLIDQRGNRGGFPFAVANELAKLLAHYRKFVHPPPPDERWSGVHWS